MRARLLVRRSTPPSVWADARGDAQPRGGGAFGGPHPLPPACAALAAGAVLVLSRTCYPTLPPQSAAPVCSPSLQPQLHSSALTHLLPNAASIPSLQPQLQKAAMRTSTCTACLALALVLLAAAAAPGARAQSPFNASAARDVRYCEVVLYYPIPGNTEYYKAMAYNT